MKKLTVGNQEVAVRRCEATEQQLNVHVKSSLL